MINSIVSQRLLQASTIAITRMLKRDIMLWLTEVGEARAATWFNDNWTGERGKKIIPLLLPVTWVTICPLVSSLTGDT